MEKFNTLQARVAPLNRANVDTDVIIPKQFLKSIKRSGFGPHLFDALRYLDEGALGMRPEQRQPNPQFVLNQDRFRDARILLAGDNFGCGSSREHAPWALLDYGFRVVIAPSFADIFYNNSFKNGLLLITLDAQVVAALMTQVEGGAVQTMTVDLAAQTIRYQDESGQQVIAFDLDPFRKHCLINGLDDIGLTLQHVEEIKVFEHNRRRLAPWLFGEID